MNASVFGFDLFTSAAEVISLYFNFSDSTSYFRCGSDSSSLVVLLVDLFFLTSCRVLPSTSAAEMSFARLGAMLFSLSTDFAGFAIFASMTEFSFRHRGETSGALEQVSLVLGFGFFFGLGFTSAAEVIFDSLLSCSSL